MSDPIDRVQEPDDRADLLDPDLCEPLPTDPEVFWRGEPSKPICPICYGRGEVRVYHGEPSQGAEWVPCEVCRPEREDVPL